MNSETVVNDLIEKQIEVEREIDRLKSMGAVEMNADGSVELDLNTATLGDVGIHNRRAARAAGIRHPKRERKMAVPKRRR